MRKTFASLLIVVSVLYLLDVLQVYPNINFSEYSVSLILIVLGLIGLSKKSQDFLFSSALLIVGVIFLLQNMGLLVGVSTSQLVLPILIILVGISLITRKGIFEKVDDTRKKLFK